MPVAVRFEKVSKQYRLGEVGTGTLSNDLHRVWARLRGRPDPFAQVGVINDREVKSEKHETSQVGILTRFSSLGSRDSCVWALNDVSFDVEQGEILGIIGRNGAGKSTLLKLLSRVTAPSSGRISAKGRIASLLEVGTGFHPELTGRENIYLNGAILGMRKHEINKCLDEIVDFSGCAKYIDTPVKRYSSGMIVRLGFSVAAHLQCETLVIDEVLAVGDAEFQQKCLGKMRTVASHGRTILFVSHNMGAVSSLCPDCVWIESGSLKSRGKSEDVVNAYHASMFSRSAKIDFNEKHGCKAQIRCVRILNNRGIETSDFSTGEAPIVEIEFAINEPVTGVHIACIVSANDSYHLFSTADTDLEPSRFGKRLPNNYTVQLQLPALPLNAGTYHLSIGIGIPGIETFDRQDSLSFTLHDTGDFGTCKEGARRAGLLLVTVQWNYV